jgi:hypothetical protein
MNADNAVEAMRAPEQFACRPGDALALAGGGLTLEMQSFEIIRIDFL